MDRTDYLPEALVTIAGTFGIEPAVRLPEPASRLTLEDVRAFVAGEVERLLNTRPDMLMSILYRVDVPEDRVKSALAAAPPGELPVRLADLIIERQLQKIRTRHRYGGPPDSDTPNE